MNQHELDTLMQTKGHATYDKQVASADEYGRETRTKPMRFTLRKAVSQLVDALTTWTRSYRGNARRPAAIKRLAEIPFDLSALIAAQIILDSFSVPRNYMEVAKSIGREIEGEVWFRAIEEENPGLWTQIVKSVDTSHLGHTFEAYRGLASGASRQGDTPVKQAWSLDDRVKVGIVMVEMFASRTGLIELRKRNTYIGGKIKTIVLIHPTPEAEEWMREAHEYNRNRTAYYLPMVEPPIRWTNLHNGGYRTNVIRQVPLVRLSKLQRVRVDPDTMPQPFAAVNSAQSVEWTVDREVYNTLDYIWSEDIPSNMLPSRDPEELPPQPKPWVDKSTEVIDWKRAAARVHRSNSDLQSKRALVSKIHSTAKTFEVQKSLWFPHKADWRGRLYPIPTCGITPQGCDMGKGLLSFRNKLPIETTEARDWHSIHGANVFGLDKSPLEERIAWTEDNGKMITAISEDPIGVTLWQKADQPWQFLQFCFDRAAYLDADANGQTHYSGLPVAMDATNSGLQLYSLLLRDEAGAAATNVLDTGVRRDIYQDIADKTYADLVKVSQGMLAGKVAKGDDQEAAIRYAKDWLAFIGSTPSRSMTKRPVMVYVYGATPHSCRGYIEDWYDEEIAKRGLKETPPFKLIFRHCHLLAGLVWDNIRSAVTSASQGMDWLQEVAKITTNGRTTMQWTSPSGFVCTHAKMKHLTKRVKTKVGREAQVDKLYRVESKEISYRGQTNGIAPNYIHSIDAALLARTVNECVSLGIRDLGLVHDSYSTHAANAHVLGRVLREQTAAIFADDLLGKFKTEVETFTNLSLPPTPTQGKLDPECVLTSRYYFS
jgi:DNA-directed RNA polymerase